MRWLGALLLVGASASIGWLKTAGLRRKIALLDEICQKVTRLRTELLQRNAPLPDLLEMLGQNAMAEGLRRGMTAREASYPLLQNLERELPQGASVLQRLAELLGRYDSRTQADACAYALEQLQTQKEGLIRELAEKGNLYRTVPLAFGLMAALAVL